MEYVPWLSFGSIIWKRLCPFRTSRWCFCKHSYLDTSERFYVYQIWFHYMHHRLHPNYFQSMPIAFDLITGIFDMSCCCVASAIQIPRSLFFLLRRSTRHQFKSFRGLNKKSQRSFILRQCTYIRIFSFFERLGVNGFIFHINNFQDFWALHIPTKCCLETG